jgi:hypothetical protein
MTLEATCVSTSVSSLKVPILNPCVRTRVNFDHLQHLQLLSDWPAKWCVGKPLVSSICEGMTTYLNVCMPLVYKDFIPRPLTYVCIPRVTFNQLQLVLYS